MEWRIEGAKFRAAERWEIKSLQEQQGAPHVTFGCLCGKAHWTAKNLCLGDSGSYVPVRNIFYYGDGPECACPPSQLVCIVAAD